MNDLSYLEDILMRSPQNSFSNLKSLRITNCASLTYLFTIPVAKCLMNLETLEISSCCVLKSVVNGDHNEAGVITFPSLRILSLDSLPQLESMCNSVILMKLPQLMELDLNHLPKITSIFPKSITCKSAKQPLFNKVVIPKVEILKIRNMETLKEIWLCEITNSVEEVNNILMLRRIEAGDCNSLVDLFPRNPMRLLSHLEELHVECCSSIEVLFNIDLGLLIHDFQALEYIDIRNCERFRNIVTPTNININMRALKYINIDDCGRHYVDMNELVEICQEEEINTMSNKEISKVAFPVTYNLHQLRAISFKRYDGVEVVFEIENPSNGDELVTTQQQPLLLLPHLEDLWIEGMNMLTHVWKCSNWNEFFILHKHQPQSSWFRNLTTIRVFDCKNIKYLFSPHMMKLLSNLKRVNIISCGRMEEVVSNMDDGMVTSTSTHTTTTLFPNLDSLLLYKMDNLKHIGGGVANGTINVIDHGESKFSQLDVVYWSLCQYSKKICIDRCDALSSVIPAYAAGRIQKLQVLKVKKCRSMIEVFETKEIKSGNGSGCSSSSSSTTIQRQAISTVHELSNLKTLTIVGCERLEYIFPFSTLETLKELKTLTIRDCEALKVVVREEYEEHTTISSKDVVFPCLKSIKLARLPNLEGFFLGTNIDFQWPLLDYVEINYCPQMTVFTSGRSMTPSLRYIHTKLGKHILECGLNFNVTPMLHQTLSASINSRPTISERRLFSFHNLIECRLDRHYDHEMIFPSKDLQQLEQLETIHAYDCLEVKEVFEVTNNESQNVVEFPKLREVGLDGCWSLKYIWKSNHRKILKFPNLTRLSIHDCYSLEHVFTCSMVGCVMQLQELHIQKCIIMKVIVKGEEDYEEWDAQVSEIIFPCLKSLKLEDLEQLEGFCLGNMDITFQSLDNLVIKSCPEIMVITKGRTVAPKLTTVETNYGTYNVGEDINSFIMTKKKDGLFTSDEEIWSE